jgi:hypothetical protein
LIMLITSTRQYARLVDQWGTVKITARTRSDEQRSR